VEGVTLAEHIEVSLTPFSTAIDYVIQVLEALRSAHELGIVHRAVTPENIIVTPEGQVKLTGFTYARSATDPRLTKVGVSLGDVHYMSPEQVRGLPSIDQRSDLYSCGLVLYQLLTGQRAFESMSQFEVMAAQVNLPPRPPSRLCQRLPLGSDAVVLKALAKDAARRYQSASEFLRELQMLLADSTLLDAPVQPLLLPSATPPPPVPVVENPKPAEPFFPQEWKPAATVQVANHSLWRWNSTDMLVLAATLVLIASMIILVRL
jgi:eukaryotic-like serine/threonine-protein kinase